MTVSLTQTNLEVDVKYTVEIPNYSSERNQSIRTALLDKGYLVTFEEGVFQSPTRVIDISYKGDSLDVDNIKFNAENVLNLIINSFTDLDSALSQAPPTSTS